MTSSCWRVVWGLISVKPLPENIPSLTHYGLVTPIGSTAKSIICSGNNLPSVAANPLNKYWLVIKWTTGYTNTNQNNIFFIQVYRLHYVCQFFRTQTFLWSHTSSTRHYECHISEKKHPSHIITIYNIFFQEYCKVDTLPTQMVKMI